MDQSFFDLGGHSLLATRVVSRLRELFRVELPLRDLLAAPTVRTLARRIGELRRGGAAAAAPPMRPVDRRTLPPLSFAQERLWFIDQLDPGSAAYNMASAVRFRGRLELPALAASLQAIVRRHEALRTVFTAEQGQPRQAILRALRLGLPLADLSALPAAARETQAARLAAAAAIRPFDLAVPPLLRLLLLRLAPAEHLAVLVFHHIVSDGWSMSVFVRELVALYGAMVEGRPPRLPALPVQYADFAAWQRGWLSGETLAAELAHWRAALAGAPRQLELPADRPRPAVQGERGGAVPIALPVRLGEALAKLARQEGATLFMVLLAGFEMLLSRYGGQRDLLVGSPIANRNRLETEGLIGFFVNTLVLRADLRGGPPAPGGLDIVARVRDTALAAYAHQDLPFEKLVEELAPARDLARSPLFQVMFSLENTPRTALELPGLEWSPVALRAPHARFDLALSLAETASGIEGEAELSLDLFDMPTIQRLAGHFANLLAGLARHPASPWDELPLLAEQELHQLGREWNDVAAAVPPRCLHELVAARAQAEPDVVALVFGASAVSFGELASRANQLARHLVQQGVRPEDRLGLYLERCPAMVVAMLGVLAAGAAYVPLDPGYPRAHLLWMARDAGLRGILGHGTAAAALGDEELPGTWRLDLDGGWQDVARQPSTAPPLAVAPDQAAYVLYTSGSTGRPKGVAITHRAVVNHALWMAREFPLGPREAVLQQASISFDASVWELFGPLTSGARLVLAMPGGQRDPAYLAEEISRQGDISLQLVPTLLRALLEEPAFVAAAHRCRVFSGGEALAPELRERFLAAGGRRLINTYGPTEATIDAAFWRCGQPHASGALPIGRPIANGGLLALGPDLQPVPIGVPGELCVRGAGLARGYLDRPELTAARFVPDPLAREPGDRVYRTGDRVRLLADGAVDFLGRLDHQVKLRGFRIELGEIEAVLAAHPAVREAAVALHEDRPGAARLVAYAVPRDEAASAAPAELRDFLAARLPEHMVPAAIVLLAALPLAPSGKLDRRALPAPALPAAAPSARLDALEQLLAQSWEELLGVPVTGAGDDFFALGGHSLLAVRLVSRLREQLGMELTLRGVFEARTLAGMAALVRRRARPGEAPPPLAPQPPAAPRQLSFAQERLWFLDRLEGGGTYNVPQAVHLRGALSLPAWSRALDAIVARHEVLRTWIDDVEGLPVPRLAPPPAAVVPVVDLAGLPPLARQALAVRLAHQEASRAFDLRRGPMARFALLRLVRGEAAEHVALLTFHHIVADAWSMEVFLQELVALYGAFSAGRAPALAPLPLQYADFAAWQRRWLTGPVLERELAAWRSRLAGAPQVLELPTDRPRPAVQSFRGGLRRSRLAADLAPALRARCRDDGATPFMVLLALVAAQLGRYTGQGELLLGTPVANRGRLELEGLIGLFLNTLVLRIDLAGDPGLRALVRRAREVSLDAFTHQDLPFERLVEELVAERHLARSPLFQVLLVVQPPARGAELPGIAMQPFDLQLDSAKFDLTLFVLETGDGGLDAMLEYSRDLFDAATAGRFLGHLEALATRALADPEEPLAAIDLLTAPERQALLREWNDTFAAGQGRDVVGPMEAQAALTPDAPAVFWGDLVVSHGELAARCNRLAHRLRREGVAAGAPVALLLERSVDMVVAVIGTLKAGGAYVPLDPAYPRERLAMMLQDCGARVLVTQTLLEHAVPVPAGCAVLRLDGDAAALGGESAADPPRRVDGDDLAYVIYTSGSTGRPKGVAMTHRALGNLVEWQELDPRLRRPAWTLQFSSLSFDASFQEIVTTFRRGGTLVLIAEETRRDPRALLAVLRETMVERLYLPFVALRQLAEAAQEPGAGAAELSLLEVLTAGEQLQAVPAVTRFFAALPRCRLRNWYGPSETHVVTALALPDRPAAWQPLPPIGRPIANTAIYLVDRGFELVPPGVPGELLIGGLSLARGYLERPDTTAERFIPDPWSAEAGARLYRTGDRSRWRVDGEVEFLGRIDQQVKVRGYRIEPGEIEAVLAEHPAVRAAVVAVQEEPARPGERRLVAYASAREGCEPRPAELRTWVSDRLPAYMVPALFVTLDHLPLTPSGKVDRRALATLVPAPAPGEAGKALPSTPLEEMIAGIWSELLGIADVGAEEGFFELGGHSLLATRVTSRLRRLFGVELPVRAVFEAPTVRSLACRVEQARATGEAAAAPPPAPAGRDGDLPLSFAQERLWFVDRLDPGAASYNLPTALRLTGALNGAARVAAVRAIVRRHEVLRTAFAADEGRPRQVIAPHPRFEPRLVDLSGLPAERRAGPAGRLLAAAALRPFDLARGPLLRFHLLRLGPDDHLALLCVHHIAFDGWSAAVFMRELAALYEAAVAGRASPLPELPLQYADFALWQRRWLAGGVLERQLAYWRAALAGAPQVLTLPTDLPRPEQPDASAAAQPLRLSSGLSAALQAVGRREGTTLFMTLLAAFGVLMSRHAGQPDLLVGTPIANRQRVETEDLIGLFANTLVLRCDLRGGADGPSVQALLARIRETTLAAYAHQDLPFARLVEELSPARNLALTPLFQVMFLLDNTPSSELRLQDVRAAPVDIAAAAANFDLVLGMAAGGASLEGGIQYRRELWEPATIRRLAGHWETLLAGFAGDPAAAVGTLPLLSAPERHQLAHEWNDTRTAAPGTRLDEMVRRQARRSPDAVAVTGGGRQLTRAALDRRAASLARRLRRAGIGAPMVVGLLAARLPDAVAALLAILRCGAAYLPLDPADPRERRELILADAGVQAVIGQRQDLASLELQAATIRVFLDDVEAEDAEPAHGDETPSAAGLDQLAYVIYTSGSTGRPKGVMVTHRGLCNYLEWAARAYLPANPPGAGAPVASSFSFDLTVTSLLLPLAAGLRVDLLPEGEESLARALRASGGYDLVKLTPAHLEILGYTLGAGELAGRSRLLVIGGEPLHGEDVAGWLEHAPGTRLINEYGPTETVVGCAVHAIDSPSHGPVPIGRPIANTRLLVLSAALQLEPAGVAGELYVGGAGLARGYLGRPEQTAERFVPDPLGAGGERLYRTGDRASWTAAGDLCFLGRLDEQVKIRGFRIEPGEVEAALLAHPAVRQALVAVHDGPTGRRLTAWVARPAAAAPGLDAALRAHLGARLPRHMVPEQIVELDELPLTGHGKVDRRALPAPGGGARPAPPADR